MGQTQPRSPQAHPLPGRTLSLLLLWTGLLGRASLEGDALRNTSFIFPDLGDFLADTLSQLGSTPATHGWIFLFDTVRGGWAVLSPSTRVPRGAMRRWRRGRCWGVIWGDKAARRRGSGRCHRVLRERWEARRGEERLSGGDGGWSDVGRHSRARGQPALPVGLSPGSPASIKGKLSLRAG